MGKRWEGLSVTFLDEMYAIGTLTDDHDTEYDGEHYITPSLIDHDDGKENDTSGLVQG